MLELKKIILKTDFAKSTKDAGSKIKYDAIDVTIIIKNKAGNILLILFS
jgi:hypothetical protein